MELRSRLDFPPTSTNSTCTKASPTIKRSLPSDRSDVAQGFLGTGTAQASRRSPLSDTGPSGPSHRPPNRITTTASRAVGIGGLGGSGWSEHLRNWSQSEINILESSWRESTLKTYRPIWRKWCDWGRNNNVAIDNPNAQDIAKYLCHLSIDLKLKPRTIALHKSVVTNFSNPVNSTQLSSHPLIRQVLKGIFAKNPPIRKCITWKIEGLLNFLKTYTLDESSLFAVSRHTCVLLLLATGRRVHDLTLLSVNKEAYEDRGNEIIFWPKFGSKTDSVTHRQGGWSLKSADKPGERLDPVYWIRKLITVSASRRSAKDIDNLLITTRRAVKNASRSVIGGWIRTLLEKLRCPPRQAASEQW